MKQEHGDLIVITCLLYDYFKNIDEVKQWLNKPYEGWLGRTPLDLIQDHRGEKVTEFIKEQLDLRSDIFNG